MTGSNAERDGMKSYVKELLILLHLLVGYGAVGDRLASLGLSAELFLYTLLFACLATCLVAAAYVRNAILRGFYAVMLSASALFLGSVETASGEHLTYDAFINLVNSSGFAGDAFRQYGSAILAAGLVSLPLLLGIGLSPRRDVALPRWAAIAAPLGGVAFLSLILFARGGDGARGLPGAYTPLAYGSLYTYEAGAGAVGGGTRREVTLPRRAPSPERDIVLIVDESVLGSYLDLNSGTGVRSGLRDPRPGVALHKFG